MAQLIFYKPSGKFSPIFLFHFIAVLLLAIPILSFIYAQTAYAVPFIILSGISAFIIAVLLGILVRFIILKGKVRNGYLARMIAIVSALWLWYLQWAVWFKICLLYTSDAADD